MLQVKDVGLSIFTGLLLGGGWWAFIDGAVSAPDAFPIVHILPALVATISAVMMNLVDPNNIGNRGVKIWLFFWFAASFGAVLGGIWITAIEYPPNDNWPGVSIVVMTVLAMMAGLVFLLSRKHGL